MIGRTVSQYRIVEKLGEGGMGVVYLARDTELERDVVLKFLSAGLAADESAQKRFVQEARAASALDHPNVCAIHQIGRTEDGQTYIAMPYYQGQALSERMADGRLSVAAAVDIIGQTASGLAAAHASGVVHRDIKPHNLIVTTDGRVKIIDFGLATLAGQTRLTRTGTTVGTARYMSPEQARGEDIDHRSDLFALGVILYEMLTGRSPFNGDHDLAVMYSIINSDPEPPSSLRSDIPAEVEGVVMRCLARDPADRYASADEMMADLGVGGGEASRRVARPAAARIPKRRVLLAATAVIALAILAGFYLQGRDATADNRSAAIGVMYFENLSNDPALDWMENGVVELLNAALLQATDTPVLDSNRIARVARELGGIDQSSASAVATRAGVTTMIAGSIMKSGESIRLQARIIDAGSGELGHSVHVDGHVEGDIFAMVAELTDGIGTYLGIMTIGQDVTEAWMKDITTESVDAYRAYVRGRRQFVANEHEEARVYFEQAIAADSNFVMAYVDLLGSCLNLEDYACLSWAHEQSLRLRQQATPRERLYIDISTAIITGDPESQVSLSRELLAVDPTARFWRYTLGRGHYMQGEYEMALREWQPLVEAGYYWVWTYTYASDACLELGRPEEGLRILERGVEITPPQNKSAMARLFRYRGRVYRSMGKVAEATADFEQTLAIEPEYEAVITYDFGILEEEQGNTDRAWSLYDESLTLDPESGVAEDARARIEKLRGQ